MMTSDDIVKMKLKCLKLALKAVKESTKTISSDEMLGLADKFYKHITKQ